MSRIIERVRQALEVQANDGRDRLVFAKSEEFINCAHATATDEERGGWMESIRREAQALNLQVHECPDLDACGEAIAALARERDPEWGTLKRIVRWSDPLLDELGLEARLGEDIPVTTVPMADSFDESERAEFRREVIASYIGITTADYLLADTASLVLLGGRGRARSVSLVPSIHVAVVPGSRMLGSYRQMLSRLNGQTLPSNVNIITGPSKTADIEATLVHGAHGPREMHLFVVAS
ncbi:L-lactate dehydrogenase complex protein LldG [Desulfomicrobium norvegicum]|uniref:L-lactate dehydrogenase complex protein LldG n=1 Tax=Desulfomicrobium norvegicum (strain DSM 1741 / NCIMB 8310) TaxID=52561 RepID=A0A8G2C6F3_DESNO|nr:LUD domain-containing protein [Desulfomicrobium norvegicum]SFM14340.1 L-lactate dehydrogenase complex protein LldG [Desulfomicrobium norvegicum]